MLVVLLGPPGSGKGTQALRVCEKFKLLHVSTGQLLREAIGRGEALGLKAKAYMDRGNLVPDSVIEELLATSLSREPRVLLDGFPRNLSQATILQTWLTQWQRRVDCAINLEVPSDVLIQRMLARGRSDDTRETIARRLDVYTHETQPVLAHYEQMGVLNRVDGSSDVSTVSASIEVILSGLAT